MEETEGKDKVNEAQFPANVAMWLWTCANQTSVISCLLIGYMDHL